MPDRRNDYLSDFVLDLQEDLSQANDRIETLTDILQRLGWSCKECGAVLITRELDELRGDTRPESEYETSVDGLCEYCQKYGEKAHDSR